MKDLNKENLLQAVSPYSFCERHGDINTLPNFQYIRIATEFERKLSFESFGTVSNLFSNSRYRKIPNIDVFRLDNLTLFGHGMLCFNNEKVMVCDALHIWPNRSNSKINSAIFNYDVDNSNLIIKRDLKRRFIRGLCIPMSRPGEGTYGHWLVDFLPRLLLLRTLGIKGKYVFTDRIPDYAWQFFNLLGLDETDIVTYNPLTECVELEQAYVPTYLRSEDQFSSLISSIPRFFPLSKQVKGNKIYVARGDFRENQKVLNDDLVMKSVLNFGFEIIYPHKLTIAQQIEIFSKASIVVGEYGSAMHNTLFCHPGTKVVLLQSNQILSMIQVGLGNALSHKTLVLFCEALDNSNNSRSFEVDIELLNTILKNLCNVDNSVKQGLTLFQKVKGLFSR